MVPVLTQLTSREDSSSTVEKHRDRAAFEGTLTVLRRLEVAYPLCLSLSVGFQLNGLHYTSPGRPNTRKENLKK